MTSLPISLPSGATPLVKEGDTVKKGQVIAKVEQETTPDSSESTPTSKEVSLSLPEFFGDSANKVGKYLLKHPGDPLSIGDVVAVKKGGMTLKQVRLVSQVNGIVLRFERGSGNLILRIPVATKERQSSSSTPQTQEILAPLDGKVSLCNNEKIVLESESDALAGVKGNGFEVVGELETGLYTAHDVVTSTLLTREVVDKIILVKAIEKEALVKADAIGVKGIVATNLSDEDLAYLQEKHPDLPVVEVDEAVAKKLQKTKATQIVLNGREQTIIEAA